MRIKNNPKLFYLICGLIAAGDRRYDENDAEIAALAGKIAKTAVDADILKWFAASATGDVAQNPYWPRGHAMLMAALFMEDSAELDIDQFMQYLDSVGMTDPAGAEDFRCWIGRLPEILARAEGVFRDFWKEYCEIIIRRMNGWMPEIEASRLPLKEFFGSAAPNLVLVPNLFADPFAADFARLPQDADTIVAISYKPDVESMLRKVLRDEIAAHSDKIMAFGEEHGIGAFADIAQMKELGHMQQDCIDPAACAYIIEECFARALSIILSGGGNARLQSHAGYGFTGLPMIVETFEKHKPKIDGLGEFIEVVLREMSICK